VPLSGELPEQEDSDMEINENNQHEEYGLNETY